MYCVLHGPIMMLFGNYMGHYDDIYCVLQEAIMMIFTVSYRGLLWWWYVSCMDPLWCYLELTWAIMMIFTVSYRGHYDDIYCFTGDCYDDDMYQADTTDTFTGGYQKCTPCPNGEYLVNDTFCDLCAGSTLTVLYYNQGGANIGECSSMCDSQPTSLCCPSPPRVPFPQYISSYVPWHTYDLWPPYGPSITYSFIIYDLWPI